MANLLATKPIKTILDEAHETGEHSLKRALGPSNLIALGIGAIIGTGIFVITGTATAQHAGPAIILSFVFAATDLVLARPPLLPVGVDTSLAYSAISASNCRHR